jgi:hypothetical protein
MFGFDQYRTRAHVVSLEEHAADNASMKETDHGPVGLQIAPDSTDRK